MPKQENLVTISAMPWRAGLTNQGGQATIPENALWDAKNAEMDFTGRLFKRKAFRTWGQSLETQNPGGLQYTEVMDDVEAFAFSSTLSLVTVDRQNSNLIFRTQEATDGTGDATYIRDVQPSDGTHAAADDDKATVIFTVQPQTALPAQNSDLTDDAGPAVHIRTDHANILTLLFLSDDIYYYNGTNFVASGASLALVQGRWNKVHVNISDAAVTATTMTVNITLNEATTATTVTATTYTNLTIGANQVAISAKTNSNATYTFAANMVQYRDGDNDDWAPADFQILRDWQSVAPVAKHLIAVASDVIYEDTDIRGSFRALTKTPRGDTVFIPWLSELLICGANAAPLRYDGHGAPIAVPAEMPNDIIAGTAHQGRVFAVAADRPLTVRYSGANDLSQWKEIDLQGAQLEANFNIPDARGQRITAMRGDFYGMLIIWTESSTWVFRTNGNPRDDGILQQIAANIGCIGPRAHDAIGGDIIFLNTDGIYTLATVQEYGDVAAGALSAKLQGLWQHDNWVDQRKSIPNRLACVVHAANESKTYITVQRGGHTHIQSIYVFNHSTKEWTGPYEFDSALEDAGTAGIQCADYVYVGDPGEGQLMIASSSGKVAAMIGDKKSDFAVTVDGAGSSIPFFVRSARLDGRSLDPNLIRKYKLWQRLRLYVLPRDGSKIKVTWNADGQVGSDTVSISQNSYDEPLLDSTFVLGQSKLGDPERVGVLHFPLQARARWLEFTVEIESDSVGGKDVAIAGFEIDALVGGEELN